MDGIIKDNLLCLPFGTKLGIAYQRSTRKTTDLINGNKPNEYLAIFDENDVDFEISCDNREFDRRIGLELVIGNKKRSFYIPPLKWCTIRTLESYGPKLHVISENAEEGRALVAQTAHKYGINYDLASVIRSTIKFSVEVEECPNKMIDDLVNVTDITLIGTKIKLFVRTFTGKTIYIDIGLDNTVDELKMIIAKREAIPTHKQRLVFCGKQLEDEKQLTEYNIETDSTIHLLLRMFGGEQLPLITDNNDDDKHSTYSYSDESDSDSYTDSLDETISTENDDTNVSHNNGSSQLFSGERGVICYGERSNDVFPNNDKVFIADHSVKVNSFVIEMRMESKIA